jgi:hypothetical protein
VSGKKQIEVHDLDKNYHTLQPFKCPD